MGVQVAAEVSQDEGAFEVMQVNADTIRAWLSCGTQWRAAVGFARLIWLGLDYAGVDAVLRRLKLADPDSVFDDLLIMEDAALEAFAEAAA